MNRISAIDILYRDYKKYVNDKDKIIQLLSEESFVIGNRGGGTYNNYGSKFDRLREKKIMLESSIDSFDKESIYDMVFNWLKQNEKYRDKYILTNKKIYYYFYMVNIFLAFITRLYLFIKTFSKDKRKNKFGKSLYYILLFLGLFTELKRIFKESDSLQNIDTYNKIINDYGSFFSLTNLFKLYNNDYEFIFKTLSNTVQIFYDNKVTDLNQLTYSTDIVENKYYYIKSLDIYYKNEKNPILSLLTYKFNDIEIKSDFGIHLVNNVTHDDRTQIIFSKKFDINKIISELKALPLFSYDSVSMLDQLIGFYANLELLYKHNKKPFIMNLTYNKLNQIEFAMDVIYFYSYTQIIGDSEYNQFLQLFRGININNVTIDEDIYYSKYILNKLINPLPCKENNWKSTNILVHGKPGTSKTKTIHYYLRKLFIEYKNKGEQLLVINLPNFIQSVDNIKDRIYTHVNNIIDALLLIIAYLKKKYGIRIIFLLDEMDKLMEYEPGFIDMTNSEIMNKLIDNCNKIGIPLIGIINETNTFHPSTYRAGRFDVKISVIIDKEEKEHIVNMCEMVYFSNYTDMDKLDYLKECVLSYKEYELTHAEINSIYKIINMKNLLHNCSNKEDINNIFNKVLKDYVKSVKELN